MAQQVPTEKKNDSNDKPSRKSLIQREVDKKKDIGLEHIGDDIYWSEYEKFTLKNMKCKERILNVINQLDKEQKEEEWNQLIELFGQLKMSFGKLLDCFLAVGYPLESVVKQMEKEYNINSNVEIIDGAEIEDVD